MATKPGYKTTEFWLTFAATLVGLLISSGLIAETSAVGKTVALAASALAAAGYSYSRALTKGSSSGT
jgi:hypothetical protein